LGGSAVILLFATSGIASADPVQHFGTFEVQCGSDVLELTEKPAMVSAQVVAMNGEPTNAVTVLMGVIVTVEGVGVVEEFHKPFSSNQDVTVCTQNPEPGVTIMTETHHAAIGRLSLRQRAQLPALSQARSRRAH
jgi:hypothetical protein